MEASSSSEVWAAYISLDIGKKHAVRSSLHVISAGKPTHMSHIRFTNCWQFTFPVTSYKWYAYIEMALKSVNTR